MESISLTKQHQTEADQKRQKEVASAGPIPEHIAVIMDGNGRWAERRGSVRIMGHKAGVDSVRDITEASAQLGVRYLTLFAFSTENWGRPGDEVRALFRLLVSTLRKETEILHRNNIRLTTIGQIDRFPSECRREIERAEALTRDNDRMQLILALSYSGRWDITEAVRSIAESVKRSELNPDSIDENVIKARLSTAGIPDPDLIVRTSGEFRVSNFLLWQLAYSELFVSETCWPEFRRDELYRAILSYQKRERRYGKLNGNVRKNLAGNGVKHITS
ncbi:MAG: isoprenyl transferase [Balneolaceae bacterium]